MRNQADCFSDWLSGESKRTDTPHLGRDLISQDSAGVPLDQTATENHALVKASFKHENAFYRVKKGDLFEAFYGCAHETENKARLGVPEDCSTVRLKENALEFDCSAFYGTTATGRPAVSLCRIALLRTKMRPFLERFSEHRITVVWLLTDRREQPYVDSPEALEINNFEESGISGGGLIYNFSVWEGKNGNSRTIGWGCYMSDYINEYLTGMMTAIGNMQGEKDPFKRQAIKDSIGELQATYNKERLAAEKEKPESQRRKDFERYQEQLAKGLPGITKGTLSAVTAFKTGDAIAGSAAVMEICSTLASTLGALSVAGGPPGMLLGAVFSMISMILNFFAPEPESLISQLETLMRDLQAEEKESQIDAAVTAISVFTSACDTARNKLLDPGAFKHVLKDLNPIEGNTLTYFRTVQGWLMKEGNQKLKNWPKILNAQCKGYGDMMLAFARVNLYAHDSSTLAKYIEDPDADDAEKARRKVDVRELQQIAQARFVEAACNDDVQLNFLKKVVPTAQNRGMVWYIDDTRKGHLYAGSNLREGSYKYLGGESKRMSVTMTRENVGRFNPELHVFSLEVWIDQGWSRWDRTYHGKIGSPYTAIDQTELKDFHSLSDIWAIPSLRYNQKEIFLYTAKGNAVHGYVLDENSKVTDGNWGPAAKSRVLSVRAVQSPKSFPDDPAENKQLPSVLKDVAWLVYGGLDSSSDIFVNSPAKTGYVPSPWESYSGIGVDQGYLWVFGSGGFACATHTSVISCLERGNGAPRWIVDYPNDLLYHGDQKWLSQEPPPPLKGLTDLCPCDDGTVVAALYTRTVTNVQVRYSDRSNYFYWKSSVDDSNALYTGSYRTDLKEGKIAVDWAKIPGNGVRVQKLPIFCWPLIEGSIKALTHHGPELALMPWEDGSGVPISGKNLIIVGVDNKSHLHIRIFDDIGKRVTDTDETKLPPGKANAISILKGQLQTLLPPHLLTSAEKVLFIGEVKSIVDQAPKA